MARTALNAHWTYSTTHQGQTLLLTHAVCRQLPGCALNPGAAHSGPPSPLIKFSLQTCTWYTQACSHKQTFPYTFRNTVTHRGSTIHRHTPTYTLRLSVQSQQIQCRLPPGGHPGLCGAQPWDTGLGPSPVMGVGSRQVKQHCPGPSHHSSRGQSSSGHGVKEHSTSPFWKKAKGHGPVRAAPQRWAI